MNNSSKLCSLDIKRGFLIKGQFFLVCICVAIGSIRSLYENCVDSKFSIIQNEQFIDPEHLADYPYCGSMNIQYTDEPAPRVRAVNTNKTDYESNYRWLVFILSKTWKTIHTGGIGSQETFINSCTGAIITER